MAPWTRDAHQSIDIGAWLAAPPGVGAQVFLRIQWQTEVVRGASVKVEVDMAGASLLVMGGLQDELFNFTIDSLHTVAVSTRLDMTVRACEGLGERCCMWGPLCKLTWLRAQGSRCTLA